MTGYQIQVSNSYFLIIFQQLMEENNELRELLQHTENELVNLLNKEHKDVVAESAVGLDLSFNYTSGNWFVFKCYYY